jgi:outer membrane biosynthesis protein TonB
LQRPEKDVPAMAGRRRSGLAIAAAGLVILLLGLAATFVVQQEPEAPAEVAVGAHAPAAEIPPAVVKPQAKAAEEAIAVAATPSTTTTPEVVPPRQPQPVTPSPEAVTEKEKSVPERPAPAEPDARRSSGKGVTQEPVQVQAAAPKETVVQVPASDAPAEPFVPVQKEPRVVRLVKPEVGPAVLKLGGTGEVIAQVLIGVDGKPRKVRILKSTNELLNEAVATALLGSEFEPGVMTTGPVESWLTVPFKFR